jgi:glycosyltransferase involved in cell wall biosynthesis
MQLIANLDRGGGQEVVRTLVRHLPDEGVDPVVVTLRDGPLRAEIEGLGVPVEVVVGDRRPITAGARGLADLGRLRSRLAGVADRHRVDVIQTHLLRSLDFVAMTLRRPGRRAVFWTVHNAMLELRPDQLPSGDRLLGPKRTAHRWLYRAGARLVDGFIAVSTDVASAVRETYGPPRNRLAVIPNGVDIDRYRGEVDRGAVRRRVGITADAPTIIVVAKLMEQKGHAVLLDALPAIRAQVPDVKVLFVGEGELRADLEERIRSSGLDGVVRTLGDRADVADLLAASEMFVLPSRWEGLPMALLEAMAAGRPVVASAVSGTREVVEDGVSGLLVPPGDPAALARAVVRVLSSADEQHRLGHEGRIRVEACYSARAQARRHAELFRSRLMMPPAGGGT